MLANFRFSRRLNASRRRARGGIAPLWKILHAEPPLNPLYRVEVIFARIFLVFCPSSRIGGSRFSLSFFLSLSLSLLSALAFFLSLAPPSSRILALSSSICQFIFVSLFPSWRVLRHGQFRGHEVALHLSETRESLHPRASRPLTHAKFSRTILNCYLQVSDEIFLFLLQI